MYIIKDQHIFNTDHYSHIYISKKHKKYDLAADKYDDKYTVFGRLSENGIQAIFSSDNKEDADSVMNQIIEAITQDQSVLTLHDPSESYVSVHKGFKIINTSQGFVVNYSPRTGERSSMLFNTKAEAMDWIDTTPYHPI